MEMFNDSMSSVRVSVEWLFGDILNYFKFLDFKKNLKIGLSSIGKTYVVCALLRNALTCLYGNQTADFFELDSPSLQDYFRWIKKKSRKWQQKIYRYYSINSETNWYWEKVLSLSLLESIDYNSWAHKEKSF